ncbi:MAG: hypothetical protein HC770_10725 [Pseudanabaena sp. CRU_2_10]|nr:hypothetical protein [Pseudanabaena sp. CRU_2_10]
MKIHRYLAVMSITMSAALTAIPIPLGFAQTIKRDYETSTPLPQTKQVTIRQPLSSLTQRSPVCQVPRSFPTN